MINREWLHSECEEFAGQAAPNQFFYLLRLPSAHQFVLHCLPVASKSSQGLSVPTIQRINQFFNETRFAFSSRKQSDLVTNIVANEYEKLAVVI